MLSRALPVTLCFGILTSASSAQAQVGGWLSASATLAKPASDNITQVALFPYRQEQGQATHIYPTKNKPSFDIGGGVRFGQFGVGIAVSRYEDNEVANADLVIPNRYFFNRSIAFSGVTQNPLKHEETVLHLEGRYIANLPHASVAVFAGPSYFKIVKELVTGDRWQEVFSDFTFADSFSYIGYSSRSEDVRAWGYNVGVDGSYYFSDYVGVGGLFRFSQATVHLPNTIQGVQTGTSATTDAKVGGLSVGGGVRFRF